MAAGLATSGLKTPIVVAICLAFDLRLVVGIIGVGSGRANIMQGAVQLVLFAPFLFLTEVP